MQLQSLDTLDSTEEFSLENLISVFRIRAVMEGLACRGDFPFTSSEIKEAVHLRWSLAVQDHLEISCIGCTPHSLFPEGEGQ